MKFVKQGIVCSSTRSVDHISAGCSDRILSVISIERVHGINDLGEIVFRLRLSGLGLDGFESGKEQADQNRNDRDDDEQLDESESRGTGVSVHRAGSMPS